MDISSRQTTGHAGTLIIKPAVAKTVPVQIIRGEKREFVHINEGQFVRGEDIPEAIDRRFDLWENLRGQEARAIELREDPTIESTTYGLGEVQPVEGEEPSEGEASRQGFSEEGQVVRLVFSGGHSQKYLVDRETSEVEVPVGADPRHDDEAKILFQCWLGLSLITELTFETSQRDRYEQRNGDAFKRALRESVLTGTVRSQSGKTVEPDSPQSPLYGVL